MNLIFRADADQKIGIGHLMRCFALAQSWTINGGKIVFITNCENPDLIRKLEKESFEVVKIENSYPHQTDWEETKKVLNEYPKSWCVIDGYHFDANYHSLIRQNGNRVLVVDDTAHLDFYDADAILNQNINAEELKYNCPPETRLLLGTRYVMLRQEFSAWQAWQRETPEIARKILITMGGSDFYNQTLKSIRAIEQLKIENLQVKAVVGSSNPHLMEMENAVKISSVHIELIHNTDNMAELMVWADLAISAAGSTSWELCFMKVPTVLITIADNQIGIAEGLNKSGFAENTGWFENVSTEELCGKLDTVLLDKNNRARMSSIGRRIIDGRGTKRVIEFLCSNS